MCHVLPRKQNIVITVYVVGRPSILLTKLVRSRNPLPMDAPIAASGGGVHTKFVGGACVHHIDHGTRRRRGCVARSCRSGLGAAPPVTGNDDAAGRPHHSGMAYLRLDFFPRDQRLCGLQVAPTLRVRPCNPRLTGAMCTARTRGITLEQYCAGYAICACCIRHRPFRPIRLRMVERVLAGDAITLAGRSCRPSCADWSACTPYLPYGVHAKFMSVPSSSWLTSGKPPPVAYACGTVR
jgi:hypothetical protein